MKTKTIASLLGALLVAMGSMNAFAGDESAFSLFQLGVTTETAYIIDDATAGERYSPAAPFPLELVHPANTLQPRLRAFASSVGKVQALTSLVGLGQQAGRTRLDWSKSFTKGLASDIATFTITSTKLRLFVDPAGAPITNVVPFAQVSMSVSVSWPDPNGVRKPEDPDDPNSPLLPPPVITQTQFRHIARMQQNQSFPFMSKEQTTMRGAKSYDLAGSNESDQLVRRAATTNVERGIYETTPFFGYIDLASVPVGSKYTIQYYINTEVQKHEENEGHAEAYLGDPLDVESGFSFSTDSEPVEDSSPLQCENRADDRRFSVGSDGTATDRYTGLMWQRCPVGYKLNDQGTVARADDACDASLETRGTWQSALQSASNNSSAGMDDWRLPDIKELDSLVDTACSVPTIDTSVFPATRPGFVWTSTPDPLSGLKAKAIEFASGTSAPLAKLGIGDARLVRASGQAPILPLPAVSVGTPVPVVEGNSGSVTLVFPVTLDVPAAGAVTATFNTQDFSATAGADYVQATGTVTIPAGQSRADVSVSVLGDALGEVNESVRLKFSNLSNNARFRNDYGVGEIIDDEPVAVLAAGSAAEGNAGAAPMTLSVTLNKPAATDVSIGYATSDGAATAGVDYTAKTGTLVIPAGSSSGTIQVNVLGDVAIESDELFTVTLTSISANARLAANGAIASATVVDDDVITLRALNDTGVVLCNDTAASPKPCAQTSAFPGQDAQFGRDVTHNNSVDGVAGFSFTKLDSSGAPLANQSASYAATPWDCVKDEVTGLFWEVRTNDNGLRDKDWTYTWFNSTGTNDGGNAGTPNGGVCVNSSSCDTEKYVAAINAAGMCGHNDWRMPTREELGSIVDVSDTTSPAIDGNFFPNSSVTVFAFHNWTSNSSAQLGSVAWTIDNLKGRGAAIYAKNRPNSVRLVRAGN